MAVIRRTLQQQSSICRSLAAPQPLDSRINDGPRNSDPIDARMEERYVRSRPSSAAHFRDHSGPVRVNPFAPGHSRRDDYYGSSGAEWWGGLRGDDGGAKKKELTRSIAGDDTYTEHEYRPDIRGFRGEDDKIDSLESVISGPELAKLDPTDQGGFQNLLATECFRILQRRKEEFAEYAEYADGLERDVSAIYRIRLRQELHGGFGAHSKLTGNPRRT